MADSNNVTEIKLDKRTQTRARKLSDDTTKMENLFTPPCPPALPLATRCTTRAFVGPKIYSNKNILWIIIASIGNVTQRGAKYAFC